jgi:hypothetical protein
MGKYNGYTNWATWNVELWLSSDEPLYRVQQSWIKHHKGKISADAVEAFCEDVFPDGTPDMKTDKRMSEVNFQELAKMWEEERLKNA